MLHIRVLRRPFSILPFELRNQYLEIESVRITAKLKAKYGQLRCAVFVPTGLFCERVPECGFGVDVTVFI